MITYEEYIVDEVQKNGFRLAQDLNSSLKLKFNISSSNARKILQRTVAKGLIKSSEPVSFGKRQYAYFPKDSSLKIDVVKSICKIHRPPLFRIISTMELGFGIISYYEALKIAGTPLDNTKTKQTSLDKLISELKTLNILDEYIDETNTKFLIFNYLAESANELMRQHLLKNELDALLVPNILNSLIKQNLIRPKGMLYRNKKVPSIGVKQNNYVWDAIGYSSTTGLNTTSNYDNNLKQTFVPFDIVIHRDYCEHDLQGFYSRVQSVLKSVKTGYRKVLPVIGFSKIDPKTLNTAKQLGFITIDISTIYGSTIHQILHNIQILKDSSNNIFQAGAEIAENTLKIIHKSGNESNLNNLKGDLFEYVIYPLLTRVFTNCTIEHGKILIDSVNKHKKYEYDYVITSQDHSEIVIIETKGYISSKLISLGDNTKKNTVSWFTSTTYPFAKLKYSSFFNTHKVTLCLIASCQFKRDAISHLNNLNKGKSKPFCLDTWYDINKLKALLVSYNLKKEIKIIDKYYQ